MTHRALALVGVALLTAVPTHAQRSHLGLLAGPTAGTMSGSYVSSTSGLEMGFSFLATLDREFGSVFGLQIGVGWTQKGGQKLTLTDAGNETWGFRTAYFEVPLQAQAKFRFARGRLSLAPHAGIAVGFGLGCSYKPGEQFEFEGECTEATPGGTLQSVEVSVPFGVAFSVEFPGGSRFTIVDATYQIGLTNVLSAASDAGQSAKNGLLSFRFGFAAPLY